MAIYRTGQASMDAQGYITGYDTKWREQLTLIRPGATIFFIDAPFQAAVISEVISDTQIRAITTGGAEIGRSNYIILLHDSITVDGLAQDVAETLRYYQSKETQIEEAIEFFKNFDLKQLQDLANQVKGDAEKTANDRAATEQLKNDTQQIKDSAVAETNQIKSDTDAIKAQTQQIKDSAVTETEAIKQEAFGARDQAELARDAAGNHAVDANNAKAGAETARDEARQWAQQVNPENLLHKDQNLNDVQDKGAARAALDVPAKSESFLIENNLSEIADRAAAWLNVRPIGSTPLAGDPVGDYDAATKRWVENFINSGTVGPTMNGVKNYGVGDFHLRDSRAYIQPYEVVSDGQLLNRADWPELWAYAQMLSPISDSDWLADPLKRGQYSTGNGTTTFRVPDRNGVQTGSISGLYARGDGGNSANDGTVQQNAAPNITGTVGAAIWGAYGSSTGVFKIGGPIASPPMLSTTTTPAYCVRFEAGLDNAAYGRDNTTEVRTNSFIGVWVIRASGGFVAANTSWSVINGDTALPGNNTEIRGGAIRSVYQVAGADHMSVEVRAQGTVGGAYTPVIEMVSPSGGSPVTRTWSLPQVASELVGRDSIGTSGAKIPLLSTANTWSNSQTINGSFFVNGDLARVYRDGGDLHGSTGPSIVAMNTGGTSAFNAVSNGGLFSSEVRGQTAFFGCREFVGVSTNGVIAVQVGGVWRNFYFRNDGNGYAESGSWVNGASDIRVKKDFEEIKNPFSTMRKIKAGTWRMNTKNGGGRFGIGVLANGLYDDYPEAALENGDQELEDGTIVKNVLTVRAGDSGVLAAVHHATLLELMDKVEALEAEIAKLKASK